MRRTTATALAVLLATSAISAPARADEGVSAQPASASAPATTSEKKIDLLAVGSGGGSSGDPLLACGLSFCIPGGGQCYNGEYAKAFSLLGAAAALNLVQFFVLPRLFLAGSGTNGTTSEAAATNALFVSLAMSAVSLGLTVFGMYDAYTVAYGTGDGAGGGDGRVVVIKPPDEKNEKK